jgi:large subunit ribosomal protein L30
MHEYLKYMAKIRIKQVKSRIHCTKRQKLNLDALGLRKLNAAVEHEATPQILGMVNKVKHLLQITEI